MVVGIRAAEVFELREKIVTLTDEVKAKDLELQAIPGLVEEGRTIRNEVSNFRDASAEDKANVAAMSG